MMIADNVKRVVVSFAADVCRAKLQPLFRTELSVFDVPWMAAVWSLSNDERCAYESALTADSDKCDN